MDHFGGLDVSSSRTQASALWMTSGRIVMEVKVASEPAAYSKVLGSPPPTASSGYGLESMGRYRNGFSKWACGSSRFAKWSVSRRGTCRSVLERSQINKTDRNDARGIAQMMRVGGFTVRCVARRRSAVKSYGCF